MAFPQLPFQSLFSIIKKIEGKPISNIKKWLFEKEKQITPNPLKPWKKKTTKEKKLDIPNLQELLIIIVDKINSMVTMFNKIPEMERKIYELEKRVNENLTEISTDLESHKTQIRTTGNTPTPVHQYFRGGRTKPKPMETGGRTDDYFSCQQDWCCLWNGTTDNPLDIPNANYRYPQADFAYTGFPNTFYYQFISGTIYIDGVPSSNPTSETDCYGCMGAGDSSTYCMESEFNPTGNCDAIATVYNGTISGFDFVNVGNQGNNGAFIPIQSNHNIFTCYPEQGLIDDLILWKASTNSYYQLDETSYQLFMNSVSTAYANVLIGDLYFIPWQGGYSNYTSSGCYNCSRWKSADQCYKNGLSKGCMFSGQGNDGVCQCENPAAGCCDEGSFLPDPNEHQCNTNDDCRQGSVCRGGQCVLIPVQQQPQDIADCSCVTVNQSYSNYCNNANMADDPAYICTLGPAVNWCSWECDGIRTQRTGPKPSNRRKRK